MQQAPIPTEQQIARVADALGATSLHYSERLSGGTSSTMDVLVDGGTRLVLRRYGSWSFEDGQDVAGRESRALELLQRAGIPVPAPIWVDTDGVFEEQAIVTSFVLGSPDLSPSHPFEWAERLAEVLHRIHGVAIPDSDAAAFPQTAGEDEKRISEQPEVVLEHPLGEQLLRRRVMLGQRHVDQPQVFSHTDFWPGNTLWNNGDLAAVVDWESPGVSDPDMDVAYCEFDIRCLGMDKVADRFVSHYRDISGRSLPNMEHWQAVALCRPMPDIAKWVDAWQAMGRSISPEQARDRHTAAIEGFLDSTA